MQRESSITTTVNRAVRGRGESLKEARVKSLLKSFPSFSPFENGPRPPQAQASSSSPDAPARDEDGPLVAQIGGMMLGASDHLAHGPVAEKDDSPSAAAKNGKTSGGGKGGKGKGNGKVVDIGSGSAGPSSSSSPSTALVVPGPSSLEENAAAPLPDSPRAGTTRLRVLPRPRRRQAPLVLQVPPRHLLLQGVPGKWDRVG